eukprot:2022650-Pleurochrysis_carterae.AAC.1
MNRREYWEAAIMPTHGKRPATTGSLLLNNELIWTTTASAKAIECSKHVSTALASTALMNSTA